MIFSVRHAFACIVAGTLVAGCVAGVSDDDSQGEAEGTVDEVGEALTCPLSGPSDAQVFIPESPSIGSFWSSTSSLPCNQYTSCGSGGTGYVVRVTDDFELYKHHRKYRAVARWVDPLPTNKVLCEGSFVEVRVNDCSAADCNWIPVTPYTVRSYGLWITNLYGGASFCVMPDAVTADIVETVQYQNSYRVVGTASRLESVGLWPYSVDTYSFKRVTTGMKVIQYEY
jgi:hypothetical protein